jgi:hypothetical protein
MQTARRWASAKNKRLPPLMKSVLVRLKSGWGEGGERVTIGWRVERNRWIALTAIGSQVTQVTHWMPLPPPPSDCTETVEK